MGKKKADKLLDEAMPAHAPLLKRGTAFSGVEGGFKAWEKDHPGSKNPFRESYEAQLAGEFAVTQPLDDVDG